MINKKLEMASIRISLAIKKDFEIRDLLYKKIDEKKFSPQICKLMKEWLEDEL